MKQNSELTLNFILQKYLLEYLKQHHVTEHQLKVLNELKYCRTGYFGSRTMQCDSCGHTITLFNSCKNRHCPQCQELERAEWRFRQKQNVLPVAYYHIIFTLPDNELNQLVIVNQSIFYNTLFEAARRAIDKLIKTKTRHLGFSKTGFSAIIHTWGGNLSFHPHLHILIPAGGLNDSETEWIHPKYDNFFVPEFVAANEFQKQFVELLEELNGKFYVPNDFFYRENDTTIKSSFINKLKRSRWVCKITDPYTNPETVIDYFGRYSNRVALANSRIISLENDFVKFRSKDHRTSNWQAYSFHVFEFIRRFSMHILPQRFVKIRHFGIFGNNAKKKYLPLCRALLSVQQGSQFENEQSENCFLPSELLDSVDKKMLLLFNVDIKKCKVCSSGSMRTTGLSYRIRQSWHSHAPPASTTTGVPLEKNA